MKKLLLLISMFLASMAFGQDYISQIDRLAFAIAKAEGFGKPKAIPTRYHNPGDLKGKCLEGQIGVGKNGHAIFKNNQAGWKALKNQLLKIVTGQSKKYKQSFTFYQFGKTYAGNYKIWLKNVVNELNVEPNELVLFFVFDNELKQAYNE